MKRKIPVHHNTSTIEEALLGIGNGLTVSATALKYGVHYSTAWHWTQKPTLKPSVINKKTIITNTKTNTVNGALIKSTVQPIGKITVELEEESLLRLEEICKNEVRTLEQQVKYLVLEGMTRRNPIPF